MEYNNRANKEINRINNLKFEKFKIRKLEYSKAEYKNKIDKIIKNLLIESYRPNHRLKENKKINCKLIKRIIKPTPFQIYEKIKSLKFNISIEKSYDKLCLSPNTKSSSISTTTNNLFFNKNNLNKNENKLKFTKYYSPVKAKICRNRTFFGKKNKFNENSKDFIDFSKLIIKNDIVKVKAKINDKIIYRRNIKSYFDKYKTKNDFYKKSFSNNENISFCKTNNKRNNKNLPIIGKSLSFEAIIKT